MHTDLHVASAMDRTAYLLAVFAACAARWLSAPRRRQSPRTASGEDRRRHLDAEQPVVRRARPRPRGPAPRSWATTRRVFDSQNDPRHGGGPFREHHRRAATTPSCSMPPTPTARSPTCARPRRRHPRVLHRPRDQRDRRRHVPDPLGQLLRAASPSASTSSSRSARRGSTSRSWASSATTTRGIGPRASTAWWTAIPG